MTTFCRNNFTYSFMLVLCLHCIHFSLVVVNSDYSVVVVRGLLTAVALVVGEQGSRAFVLALEVATCRLSSCCSGALEYRLNSCDASA